jgi:DNA adenine methylase
MRYLGGKAKIAKQIVNFLETVKKPNQVFIEPFLGGCNILPLMGGERYGFDINKDVILLYQALQNGWVPPQHITEDEYINLKESTESSALRGFVGICCSYSGKWFGGYARDNTKRNYALNGHNSALKLAPQIKNAIFDYASYERIKGIKNSLIYCDPPYENTTRYTNAFDHTNFWEWVRNTSKDNDVYVSEYSAPDDFECVWSLERNIEMKSSCIKTKTKRIEKIFKIKENK